MSFAAGNDPRETSKAWESAHSVLAIRLDTLGDVLMTTPAIRALRGGRAGRRITLLTSPAGAAVARLVPELDDVIVYEPPWLKATPPRTSSAPDYEMADRLRSNRFDAAAIFTVYSQSPLPSAFICHLAGIPLRLAHCRENPYQLLTDWVREQEPDRFVRHEVRRQLDLVAAVGCVTVNERLSLAVTAAARDRVDRLLEEAGIPIDRPWAIVHPGASAPSRRYAPERFALVARSLARAHGWNIVFTGSAPERPLVARIQDAMEAPSISLAGHLDLAELAALIDAAPLLLSNNTGPVHIAAAVGTPVVDLYALTNPQHTPWQVPSRVLSQDVPCKYCYRSVCPERHHHCLSRISPAEVVNAVLELFRETSSTPSVAERSPHGRR